MRLTLQNKKPLLLALGKDIDHQKTEESNLLHNGMAGCCSGNDGKKKKILIARNQQQKNLQNLIRWDCQNLYIRICYKPQHIGTTINNLYEAIYDAIQTNHSRYNQCIGYLCAHAMYHYSSQDERQYSVNSFLHAYRPIFQRPNLHEALVQETVKRFYIYLRQSDIDPSTLPLEKIAHRYQSSMLLEFIPVEYSEFIIRQYLTMSDPEEYIELATSVVHFIVNTKNPLNSAHCTEMMLNPFMGVIEWPIVIGHRKLFQPMTENLNEEQR